MLSGTADKSQLQALYQEIARHKRRVMTEGIYTLKLTSGNKGGVLSEL